MKVQFVNSLEPFIGKEQDNLGKIARVVDRDGKRWLILILPCGHFASLTNWTITDIDTDEPTATPSIQCKGTDGQNCWHGYLTKGELIP